MKNNENHDNFECVCHREWCWNGTTWVEDPVAGFDPTQQEVAKLKAELERVKGQRDRFRRVLCGLSGSIDEHAEYDEWELDDFGNKDEYPAYWLAKANELLAEIQTHEGRKKPL